MGYGGIRHPLHNRKGACRSLSTYGCARLCSTRPKSHLSLEACQAGYRRSSEEKPPVREGAQEHHIALCLVAYLIVERERLDCGNMWRQRKR